jgi:hypothetical protein
MKSLRTRRPFFVPSPSCRTPSAHNQMHPKELDAGDVEFPLEG